MSQPTQPNSVPASAAGDPFATLHHMSTTAGVLGQEYVAISPLAVVTLLVGLASFFALLTKALLVVPVVGLVCGVLALRQIKASNGTQSGRVLAAIGMALSVVLLALVAIDQARHWRKVRANHAAIAHLIRQLDEDVKARDWEHAWTLFSGRFQSQVKKDDFIKRWKDAQDVQIGGQSVYGKMTGLTWNGLLEFRSDPDGQRELAIAIIAFQFEKAQPHKMDLLLSRGEGGRWRIENLPLVNPPPAEPPPGG